MRESQRARILQAMAEVVADCGLRGATVTEVARRAGVSRMALAQHFDDLDACFLALLDWMLERGATVTADAFQSESTWDRGVLAGIEALLLFLDAYPVRARACLLEGMAGLSSKGFQSRTETLGDLGRLVDAAARRQLARERQPPPTAPEATVASVVGILRRRLLSDAAPPFIGLLGQLTEVVVAPYLGPSAAIDAASRAEARARTLLADLPSAAPGAQAEVPTMLRHASSHRLRSCLLYLSAHPQASNQDVADAIGVTHSGQVSMLLTRLYDCGLLVKDCGGPGRPNAWCLSPYGDEVAHAIFRP